METFRERLQMFEARLHPKPPKPTRQVLEDTLERAVDEITLMLWRAHEGGGKNDIVGLRRLEWVLNDLESSDGLAKLKKARRLFQQAYNTVNSIADRPPSKLPKSHYAGVIRLPDGTVIESP